MHYIGLSHYLKLSVFIIFWLLSHCLYIKLLFYLVILLSSYELCLTTFKFNRLRAKLIFLIVVWPCTAQLVVGEKKTKHINNLQFKKVFEQ